MRGVFDMLPLSATEFLVLGRSFQSGVGYQVHIYLASTHGAQNVLGQAQLAGTGKEMTKRAKSRPERISAVDEDSLASTGAEPSGHLAAAAALLLVGR
ncbi:MULTISPECIES: esterase-like activity of phytase family protein [unclassified Rathayibacter]|uniref:esterase-like activity of phytase family protein n=1 Tax=unclassified Rathayibacter TaxID=2609250 RepID=UPI0006FBD251|nr:MULTISPECIES: esterase-like activity of phytase family protein [unclassified Rathayibacter]KQQ00532.1 hypothetical protein ASF42_14325 [Rathayibacter sp. Leaf294]KQS10731.1 hypothetical protein ASG06_14325 [Rathayibacter sp. Leaf185]